MDWVNDSLVVSLILWLIQIDWFIYLLDGWLVCCLLACLIDRLIDRVIHLFTSRMVDWLINWPIDWLIINSLTDWLFTLPLFYPLTDRQQKSIHFLSYVIIHIYLCVYLKSSVEEARYLLASTGGSGRRPSAGRGMRRRSLDMVVEEQPNESLKGDRPMTSLGSQLRVPRHRNRSRSLDNSFETRNSFAAFKESLKVRLLEKNATKS